MQIFLFLISQILLHRTGFNRYIVRNKTNYLCPSEQAKTADNVSLYTRGATHKV